MITRGSPILGNLRIAIVWKINSKWLCHSSVVNLVLSIFSIKGGRQGAGIFPTTWQRLGLKMGDLTNNGGWTNQKNGGWSNNKHGIDINLKPPYCEYNNQIQQVSGCLKEFMVSFTGNINEHHYEPWNLGCPIQDKLTCSMPEAELCSL